MKKSTVSIVRTSPKTIHQDVEKLFDLSKIQQVLNPSSTTILKDNISWHFPFPAANTTPWQLEATILGLRKNGFTDISCVQNKTVVTDAFKGEDLNGYVPIFKEYNIPVLFNFKPQDMKWIEYTPKQKMLALQHVYPEGIFIPEYFIGKNIVHLPTVKCHIYTTTTGAMKNAFGGLLNTKRHYTHSWIHETLVDLLAIQKEIHSGIFAVMDGTTAGNGPGPRTMYPVVKNIMLASDDQVAIDAVAAKLMGFDPLKDLLYVRLAHEKKLGVGDVRDIEIVGDDVTNENWNFTVGDNGASVIGDIMWFGPLKPLQKLFFHTPLVHAFVLGSEVYHDYYRWPMRDRKVFEDWLRDTEWGKLFRTYRENGFLGEGLMSNIKAA